MADPALQTRDRVIDAMYQVVLDPERYDPFIEEWTKHIATVATDTEADCICDSDVAAPADDADLVKHFERANALIDSIGRRMDISTHEAATSSEFEISFDIEGSSFEASALALSPSGDPLTFSELLEQLDDDNAERLRSALSAAKTAKSGALLTLVQRADARERNQTLAVVAKKSPRGERAVHIQTLSIVWSDRLEEVISSVYALSPAETTLLHDLVDGYSLAAIADLRGRSVHTIRTHLKSVFRKTTASTQSDVIRNISAISNFFEQDRPKQIAAEVVQGDREEFRLPDGRALLVDMHGPTKGREVIFVHGMLDGTSMTREIEALLYRHDLKFVCPLRPGFGDAKREKDIVSAPKRFAQDMADFITMTGMSQPLMIGHMSGSVFAYATVHYFGSLIGGVINVSGGVPLKSLSQIHAMTPRQRTIAYTARFTPKLLPTVLRVGISRIDRDTSLSLMHDLYPPGSFDRQIATEHTLADILYDGYRFAVRQGHYGFESDSYHVIRDWSKLTARCSVPAIHVHGEHDPVVTIKSVRDFCERHDHAELHEHADAGQLVFYQKPAVVFDAINQLLSKSE